MQKISQLELLLNLVFLSPRNHGQNLQVLKIPVKELGNTHKTRAT